MTTRLARLADIAYRRRGRMVVAWIVAAVVIIPLGTSLAGAYNANYNTPGSESKAASDLLAQRFGGYSGAGVDVVWKDPQGANSPQVKARIDRFLAEAQKVKDIGGPSPTRVSRDGTIATTSLRLTALPWDVPKASGTKLIALANRTAGNGLVIKLGGDPISEACLLYTSDAADE